MKKILIAIIVLTTLFDASAQQIKVNWGTEFKNDRKESIADVIYDDGTNIYATVEKTSSSAVFVVKSKVTPALVKLDAHMTPIKRRDYTSDQDDLLYHGTYYLGGSFFILTSTFDKKSTMRVMYAQKLNKDLEPDGGVKEILKLAGEKGDNMSYKINFSDDSLKVCIMAIKESKKHENIKIALKVFDASFKPVLEKQFELENSQDDAIIVSRKIVNNNGEVYLLCKEFTSDKKKDEIKSDGGERIPGYKLVLLKYSSEANPQKTEIDLGGRFFADYFLTSDHTGNPILIVSYEEQYEDGVNGFLFYKYDNATGKTASKAKYEIPMTLATRIAKIQDDKIKSKKPGINRNFELTDIKVYDDQSMALVFEKNQAYLVSTGKTSYMKYISDGMLVMKLDKNSEVDWCSYIPKVQYYNSLTSYIYHSTMFYKNKIYIYYNDELDNETYDINNAPKAPERFNALKKMNLVQVEIDDAGKLKKTIFGTTEKWDTNIDIFKTKQLTSNRMVLCGYKYRSNEVKLGTIEFQ